PRIAVAATAAIGPIGLAKARAGPAAVAAACSMRSALPGRRLSAPIARVPAPARRAAAPERAAFHARNAMESLPASARVCMSLRLLGQPLIEIQVLVQVELLSIGI